MSDNYQARVTFIISSRYSSISCVVHKNGKLEPDKRSSVITLNIDKAEFERSIGQIINFDWNTNFLMNLENPLGIDPDNNTKILLDTTIEKGVELYKYLHDIGCQIILDMIESLPNYTNLTIGTNCAFFPFEILIKDKNEPYKQLWGYRFITNYIRLSMDGEDIQESPEDNNIDGNPNIILNINPKINDDFKKFSRLEPNKPHLDFYLDKIKNQHFGLLLNSGNEIKNSLLQSNNDATMIYVYCHGTNNGSLELLQVDANDFINPSEVFRHRIPNFSRAPIIFLNSCKSAIPAPLSFMTFLKRFQEKKAIGILGTAIGIPVTFAAVFGVKILENYLEGKYVARALFDLRRTLLDDSNNPLGLFYLLQCPADVKAPIQNSAPPTSIDTLT